MQFRFPCPSCAAVMETDVADVGRHVECPQCHVRFSVPAWQLGPGTTVGGFRLRELLGRGGMGDVYLARQHSMDRDIALKILPTALTRDPEEVERFLHEVRMAARLEHPHIVTAYEAGSDGGVYYLAMAYVRGEPLDARLVRFGTFDEKQALTLVRKIAAALGYAWNKHNLVHRDIKPANILVDEEGEPRLVDMGLSKSLGQVTGQTSAGLIVGTPNYMSPEQAQADGTLDYRSDMYALGATLYHMLTGKLPFEGTTVLETLRKLAAEPLPDPRRFNPRVSEGCVLLLEALLAKSPKHRPATWDVLLADIDTLLARRAWPHAPLAPGLSVLQRQALAHTPGAGAGHKPIAMGHSTLCKVRKAAQVNAGGEAEKAAGRLPLAAVGVAVGLVAVVGLATAVFLATRPQPPRQPVAPPAPRVVTPTAPASPAEQQLAAAREFWRVHPEDFAGATARFEAIRQSAPDTDAARQAQLAVRSVAAARSLAAVEFMKKLRTDAYALVRRGDPAAAQALVRNVQGPFAAETEAERSHLADLLKEAPETVAAAATNAVAAQRVTLSAADFDTAVCSNLTAALAGDPTAARLGVERLAARPDLAPEQVQEATGLVARLAEVESLPAAILDSFKRDVGRKVSVTLGQTTESLRIDAVTGTQVRATQIMGQAEVERVFAIQDLGLRERLKRMGPPDRPAVLTQRGLEALRAGSVPAAKECLERAGKPLGARLWVCYQAGLAARAQQVSSARETARENEALAAYRALLQLAGCQQPAAADADMLDDLRKRRPSEVKLEDVRRALKRWNGSYGDTACAGEHGRVLDLLGALVPNTALFVEQSVVDAAVARVKAANPGTVCVATLEDDGVVLNFQGSTGLADIGALKGLPVKAIDLSDTKVLSLKGLEGAPLRRLKLTHCLFFNGDLSPLKGLPLQRVDLGADTPCASLRPLAGAPVRYLRLPTMPRTAEESETLRQLELEDLCVDKAARPQDFHGLRLKRLNMSLAGNIGSLSGLEGMPLTNLCVREAAFTDLTALKGMPLRSLQIHGPGDAARGCPVVDLRDLAELPLEVLALRDMSELADLKPLSGLLTLRDLRLPECSRLSDLWPLRRLPLTRLDLTKCGRVGDLGALRSLPLTFLSIADTAVQDLKPLKDLPLVELHVRGIPAQDMSPVSGIPNLKLVR